MCASVHVCLSTQMCMHVCECAYVCMDAHGAGDRNRASHVQVRCCSPLGSACAEVALPALSVWGLGAPLQFCSALRCSATSHTPLNHIGDLSH